MNLESMLTEALNDEMLIKNAAFSSETLIDFDAERLDFDHVSFERCRFVNCFFSHASFLHCTFQSCDFSNCHFDDSFWRESEISGCKANGAVFEHTTLRMLTISNTPCRYINLSRSLLDRCQFSSCDFRESAFSEVQIQKSQFDNVDFCQSDFFKTSLKGVDLTTCKIEGILVSDHFQELRGLEISAEQAPYIAAFLGVKIK